MPHAVPPPGEPLKFAGRRDFALERGLDDWGLNPEQQETYVELFRRHLVAREPGLWDPERHDYFLLRRFLRARSYHTGPAADMWAQHLAWRREQRVDDILTEFECPQRDDILKYFPQGYHKTDKLGRPVYVQLLGGVDLARLKRVASEEQLFRLHLYEYERVRKVLMPLCSRLHGRQIETTCNIVDVKGLGLAQCTPDAVRLVKHITKADQDHFPEMLGQIFIINAPAVFRIIWNMVRGFTDARTQGKVHILGAHYRAELLRVIDEGSLMAAYGGASCGDLGDDVGPWSSRETMESVGLDPDQLASGIVPRPIAEIDRPYAQMLAEAQAEERRRQRRAGPHPHRHRHHHHHHHRHQPYLLIERIAPDGLAAAPAGDGDVAPAAAVAAVGAATAGGDPVAQEPLTGSPAPALAPPALRAPAAASAPPTPEEPPPSPLAATSPRAPAATAAQPCPARALADAEAAAAGGGPHAARLAAGRHAELRRQMREVRAGMEAAGAGVASASASAVAAGAGPAGSGRRAAGAREERAAEGGPGGQRGAAGPAEGSLLRRVQALEESLALVMEAQALSLRQLGALLAGQQQQQPPEAQACEAEGERQPGGAQRGSPQQAASGAASALAGVLPVQPVVYPPPPSPPEAASEPRHKAGAAGERGCTCAVM